MKNNTQNSQVDKLVEDLIELKIDKLLENDEFYNHKATLLKSAEAFKKEHRQRIHEFLSMKGFRDDLLEAQNLIRTHLSKNISGEEFNKVKEEFNHSNENFIKSLQSIEDNKDEDPNQDKIILLKDIFGFSNQSLLKIYELAQDFVKKEKYEEARKILTFLTTMDPQVSGFWLAQGICLQEMGKDQEAIEMYNVVKILNSEDATPFIYTAEIYIKLDDKAQAKNEIEKAKLLIKNDDKLNNIVTILINSI